MHELNPNLMIEVLQGRKSLLEKEEKTPREQMKQDRIATLLEYLQDPDFRSSLGDLARDSIFK